MGQLKNILLERELYVKVEKTKLGYIWTIRNGLGEFIQGSATIYSSHSEAFDAGDYFLDSL